MAKRKLTGTHLNNVKAALIKRNTTHGLSKTPEYFVWKEIKKRCFNVNNKRYPHYGGRGIKMWEGWTSDFVAFLDHVGKRPTDGQRWSIGRIDNNGDYCTGNVQWETDEQQARNHSLQSNNKTGVAGIAIRKKIIAGKEYHTFVARVTLNGARKTKNFSIDKYGKALAFELSIKWREEQLKEMAEHGIIYAESHGTRVDHGN